MAKVIESNEFYKNLSLQNLPDEIWRSIQDYEGLYEASSLGRIKSMPRFAEGRYGGMRPIGNKILKLNWKNKRYASIYLGKDALRYCCLVHRVIAQTFISNPDNLPCVNHKNGIRTDNRVENLEWCTYSQNTQHAHKNNLIKIKFGEEHYGAKFTEKDVISMRKMVANNTPIKIVAEIFLTTRRNAASVVSGQTWGWLKPSLEDLRQGIKQIKPC